MTHYPLEKNISGVVFIGNKGSKLLSTENNFVYDSGNNRLGINTGTPLYTLDVNGTGNFVAIRFPDGTIQSTAGAGSGFNYYDFNLAVGNESSTVISSGETISFTGFGNTVVTRVGNAIRISGLDTNTTYIAGTGLNLIGTTFNISGSTTSNSGIVQLQDSIQDNITNRAVTPNAVFDYVGSVSGAINTRLSNTGSDLLSRINTLSGNLITTGSNLQSQISSVSGLLYNYWTLNVTGSNDQITRQQTVTFTGTGATSVAYNSSTNTVTISSTDTNTTYTANSGIQLVGTTFRTFGTGFFNGINLSGSIGSTTNNLYNSGGQLYFNGYPYAYLPSGGLEGQILYKVSDTGNDLVWIDNYATELRELVKNDTGSGILKGTAVMAVGAVGDRIMVAPAIANGSIEARYMFGITSEDINNGDEGYVTLVGPIKGLVTSGYPIGTVLWLDPNIPGALTSGQPSSPNLQMSVAIVTNSHPSNGRIFVRMWEQQPGLHELHDVDVDVNLQHGDLISYNTGNSTWVNIPNFSGILQSQINTVSGLILSSSGAITSGSPYGLAYFDSGSSLKSSTINSDIQFKILANSGISFEGSQGQLFSIVNNLSSGVIFNVNDIAGLPLIEADANGYVNLVRYGETVSIGSYAESGSRLTLTPGMASRRGVVISGHPGQTADLFEVINASGNMLFAIMPDGSTAVGTGFASARLDVVDTGSNIIPTLRLMNLNANFDPYIRFTPSTTGNSFAVGIDDSDSDKFKLSYGADLGTNDRLIISTGGHVGINNTSPSDTLIVNTLNSSTKGLVVQGSAAQSANLTEWQSSAGTIHSMVNSNGWFGINKSNAVYHLDVLGTGNFSSGVRYPDGITQIIAYTGLNGMATSGFVQQVSGILDTRLISTGNNLQLQINNLSGNITGQPTALVYFGPNSLITGNTDHLYVSNGSLYTRSGLVIISNRSSSQSLEIRGNSGSEHVRIYMDDIDAVFDSSQDESVNGSYGGYKFNMGYKNGITQTGFSPSYKVLYNGVNVFRVTSDGRLSTNNAFEDSCLYLNNNTSTYKGIVFKSASSQSANLLEFLTSSLNTLSVFDSRGYLGISTGTPSYQIDVLGTGNFSAGVRYPDGLVQTIAYTGLNGIATSGYVNQISGVLNTRLISTGNDLLGRINTLSGNLITTGSNLQSQINSVSGLLYNYWTLNITGSNDQITRQQTVTFTGTGATSVSYNSSTNTVTINSIDTNTTYTAGTGLNLVGTTFNVSGSTTSNSGIVQLQDSVVDNVTNRAVTPNAVFDYVGGVSGAIDSRLVATGNNLQSQINAKDNYQYWTLRGDSATTTQIQTTEEVQFTGAGNVSISLGGTDNRRVTISGSTQAITGPAETIAFFTGNNTLTGSPSLTYDPIKTSFKLITQGDSPSTGFVILNNQNQSGNVFQIRSYIDDVDSTTYNNTYFAGTGDGSYTSNAGFNNTNTIIELLQGSGTFTTGFFPFFITGFVPGKTIIEDGAILTISNAQSFLTGLIEGDLALYTGDNNPVAPTNTGTLATQVTQLSVPIPFTISGSGSNSTTDIDLTALMNQYFNLYPTNTGNILLYYSVYSSTGSVDQQGIGAGNNASTGLRPRLDVSFTTFEYAGTSTNKPIYSVDHVGRIKIGNIERSDQLINSFLLYASGEPNQNANVQIESPNRDARVLFTKNNNKVFSAGTVGTDNRFIIKDEINWTTPFQIYSQPKNNGLIVLRNGFMGIKTFNPEYTLHVNGEGWIKALRFYRYTKESEVPRTIRNIYSIKEDLYWNGRKLALGGDFSYAWTVRDGDGNADVVGDGASIYWSGAGNVSTLFSPSSSIMRISGSPGWNLGVGNESTVSVANNANITFTGLDGIRVSRSSNQIRISGASIGPATTSTSGIVQLQDSIVDNVTDRAVTPNAVFDYVGSVSGALNTRIISTGSTLQSQINSVSGLLYNYWTLNITGSNDQITKEQTVTFTGGGATSVSYNSTTNTITISSTDNNTTYSAGTGLNLVGTTFNISGSTTSNSGIVQLQDSVQDNITNRAITPNAVFDYVGSVSGAIDTRIVNTGSNLQGQINSVSGLLYNYWTLIAPGAAADNITRQQSVTFTGTGATSVSYNTGTNVLTITSTDTNTTYSAGTGLNLVGTTFNVSGATTSIAGIIQLQDTIQDGITNRATTPNAVFDYVASVSGAIDTRIISTGNNLQGQISANDADIATLSGLINSVSGTTLGTASGVAFFSNAGTITGSPNFTYSSGTATLNINGTLTAISKSFLIDHPTKPDKKLQYSSLESPYHGVRLTGRNRLKNNTCTIKLPEYIYNLVKEEGINIQITNIRHSQIIYVESIDILNNRFTVACDNADYYHEYEFFWTFTAIRKDIDDLEVEV